MSQASPIWTCRHAPATDKKFSADSFVATQVLVKQTPAVNEMPHTRRSKIWEFNTSLHCSIVGTCLSTGELRQVLGKLGLAPAHATDHDLHGTAVSLAVRHDQSAKMLNKALDQRHRLIISRFSRVDTEAEVRTLWRDAVAAGDIPGAYWATLTHPATRQSLIREAFGEVHMLSHLVGAANRADIRRLRELEQLQAQAHAALARQQNAFHSAVVERDRRIRDLEQTLLSRIGSHSVVDVPISEGHSDTLVNLVTKLEKQLSAETKQRAATEANSATLRATLDDERAKRHAAENENRDLSAELEALESRVRVETSAEEIVPSFGPNTRFEGDTFLYVGGRANQVAHLRKVVESHGAQFLHHDGGKEQHRDLLGGLIGRADYVLFPVDCISHDAALTIKRLCRQCNKGFIPLRTASIASLLLALQRIDMERRLPGAAD